MHFLKQNKQKMVIYGIFILSAYILILKLYAAHKLSYIGDELNDIRHINLDISDYRNFFSHIEDPAQSRLSQLICIPIILLFRTNALFATRILSIVINSIYLFVFFRLLRLKLSFSRSMYGTVLASLSCYLFSFSILNMSSSDNTYILFSTLALYLYLKNHAKISNKLSIKDTAVLGIVIGLSIAAKLFGLTILVSVFIYDFWMHYKNKATRVEIINTKLSSSRSSLKLGTLNFSFLLIWIEVNIAPLPSVLKFYLMVGASILYLIACIYMYLHENSKETAKNLIEKWILLTTTALITTIIFSPIYFNINNIFEIRNWLQSWSSQSTGLIHSYKDIYIIIAVKFGLFAGALLAIALLKLYKTGRLKALINDYLLLIIVAIIQLIIFTFSEWLLTWYALMIFPFLYIPFAYIWPDKKILSKRFSSNLLIAALIFIPIFEQYRYIKIFPYGETDGAQFGPKYVGSNKPGFITFEFIPELVKFFKNNQSTYENKDIFCAISNNTVINDYVIDVVNTELHNAGLHNTKCVLSLEPEKINYILSFFRMRETAASDYHLQEIQKFKVNTSVSLVLYKKLNT